jgi:hypothetical protein
VREDDFASLIVNDFNRREVKSAGRGYCRDVFLLYVKGEGDFGIVSEIGYGYITG